MFLNGLIFIRFELDSSWQWLSFVSRHQSYTRHQGPTNSSAIKFGMKKNGNNGWTIFGLRQRLFFSTLMLKAFFSIICFEDL